MEFVSLYVDKLALRLDLKNQSSMATNSDYKIMCNNLMHEMLWEKHPTTIEMYSIKKHMQQIPTLKNASITNMKRS